MSPTPELGTALVSCRGSAGAPSTVSSLNRNLPIRLLLSRGESVALIPRCAEREASWLPADERWRAYLTEDEPTELAFYRPECGDHEFS